MCHVTYLCSVLYKFAAFFQTHPLSRAFSSHRNLLVSDIVALTHALAASLRLRLTSKQLQTQNARVPGLADAVTQTLTAYGQCLR